MITVRTSPAYVNRVRQDWTANGGVYGDGGVYALVPSNDPFAQLGPTLDLTFAGNPTDLLTASTTAGYTLDTYFTPETYQIAVPYAIWEDGVGLAQKNFADIVTFTRASTATYFNSAGTLTSAAINEARFDYNPSTLAAQGLLIEESRTNSIRNNTMVGASTGTPGTNPTSWGPFSGSANGITRTITAIGQEDGITYIEVQYSTGGGTTSASGSLSVIGTATTAVTASSGQTWTGSAYIRLVGGSLTNLTGVVTNLAGRDAVGTLLENTSLAIAPTSAALRTQRNTVTHTMADASTARVTSAIFQASYASGVAIDITLRIGLPQLELGAFATSVIPTTTTALTRSADVASVNTLSPWYNAAEGTVYADYVNNASGTSPIIWQIDNSSTNILRLRYISNQNQAFSIVSNVTVAQIYDQTGLNQTTARTAFAYKDSDFAVRTNGGASAGAPANTNSGAVPSGMNTLRIGASSTGTLNINGYLRRITYYPRRLSNADLQTITT